MAVCVRPVTAHILCRSHLGSTGFVSFDDPVSTENAIKAVDGMPVRLASPLRRGGGGVCMCVGGAVAVFCLCEVVSVCPRVCVCSCRWAASA